MEVLHEEKIGILKVKLMQDQQCDCDPRDMDNLGVMACFHGRYTLGDDVTNIKKQGKHYFPDARAFKSWVAETKPILLPLYLYDHSGITMSTAEFGCPWDSGMVGWIFCPLDKACEEYSVKKVTPTIRRKVEGILREEVKIYDAHIKGNCFGWVIEDERGECLDSTWGYHGYQDIDWDYALGEARDRAIEINESLAHAPAI